MGWRDNECKITELQGKTLTKIGGMEKGSEEVTFKCSDGTAFEMYHYNDCCECVDIDDVIGDVDDLLNSEILSASEESSHENPKDKDFVVPEYQDSFTWTFYKISTMKGSVTIRWYGSSNGYYSESVDFRKVKE